MSNTDIKNAINSAINHALMNNINFKKLSDLSIDEIKTVLNKNNEFFNNMIENCIDFECDNYISEVLNEFKFLNARINYEINLYFNSFIESANNDISNMSNICGALVNICEKYGVFSCDDMNRIKKLDKILTKYENTYFYYVRDFDYDIIIKNVNYYLNVLLKSLLSVLDFYTDIENMAQYIFDLSDIYDSYFIDDDLHIFSIDICDYK